MMYNFLKKVFSLFLVAVLIFTLSSICCFAAEQKFNEFYDNEFDSYGMNMNEIGQGHDVYGNIDAGYYIDLSYYFILLD